MRCPSSRHLGRSMLALAVSATGASWAPLSTRVFAAANARRALRRTPPPQMPEGPECLLHAQSLDASCRGRRIDAARILSGRYMGESTSPGRGAPPADWDTLQQALPATVDAVRCKGKFIWWELSPADLATADDGSAAERSLSLWSTLGMSGAWATERSAHSRIELELSDPPETDATSDATSNATSDAASDATPGATPDATPDATSDATSDANGGTRHRVSQPRRLYYNDQRNFGTITVSLERLHLDAKLNSLGPSWLGRSVSESVSECVSESMSERALVEATRPRPTTPSSPLDSYLSPPLSVSNFLAIARRQCEGGRRRAAVPLAKFLMDQTKTSGIGNYVLSETLYISRIHPWARCGDLSEEDWTAVHAAAADVLGASYAAQAAVARGALSRTRGTFAATEPMFRLQCYGRERDRENALSVRRDTGPHGRSVFWVPELQVRCKPQE